MNIVTLRQDERVIAKGRTMNKRLIRPNNKRRKTEKPFAWRLEWQSEPKEKKRVQKGGSFLCTDQYCTRYMVGARGKGEINSATNHIGFRCDRVCIHLVNSGDRPNVHPVCPVGFRAKRVNCERYR